MTARYPAEVVGVAVDWPVWKALLVVDGIAVSEQLIPTTSTAPSDVGSGRNIRAARCDSEGMGKPRRGPGASSDAELVRAAADGDAGALKALYDEHGPWLQARLMRRCNDSRGRPRRRPGHVRRGVEGGAGLARRRGRSAAWLWGIASARMVSRLERRKDLVLMPDWEDVAVRPPAEEQVLLGVEYGDLAVGMRWLSPEFRAVVQAVILDGLTTKEAGRMLGVRENTVKTRLHRAKAQLRVSLTENRTTEGWS